MEYSNKTLDAHEAHCLKHEPCEAETEEPYNPPEKKEPIEKYTIGKAIEELEEIGTQIDENKDKGDLLKQKKKDLEGVIQNKILSEGLNKVTTSKYSISMKSAIKYNCKNFNLFYDYVLKTKDFSLLRKQVIQSTLEALDEQGFPLETIGVYTYTEEKLSMIKVKGKIK